MSIITGEGEKLVGSPSIDGDQDVEVPPVPSMDDQIVVHGQKVPVIRLPSTPLFLKKSPVNDPSLGGSRVETVSGDSAPQPQVAKTRYIVTGPIHDRGSRPEFVVNLGDVDYRPPVQRPWLGPNPISVAGYYPERFSAKPEPTYRVPEADIYGGLQEEPEPESHMIWEHPPITAKIHDFSRLVSL